LEDGLAEILANGEDMLELLRNSSSFNSEGEVLEEMKKTYGHARGVLRSPNKNTKEKSVTLSSGIRRPLS